MIMSKGNMTLVGDGDVQEIYLECIEPACPGCADGRYIVRRGAANMAALYWADAQGLLEDYMPFGWASVNSLDEGAFSYAGGRAVPPGATHVAFSERDSALFQIPHEMLTRHVSGGVRLAVMSDLHYSRHEKNIRFALRCAREADCVLMAGDLTNAAQPQQFARLQEIIDEVIPDVPVLCVAGNHDFPVAPLPVCCEEMADYPAFQNAMLARARRLGVAVEQHECGAWRANVGGVDIFGICCNSHWRRFKFPRGEQLDWLEGALRGSTAWRKVVLCHAPLHAHNVVRKAGSIDTPYLSRDDRLQQIIDTNRNVCFVSGHTHISMNEPSGCVERDAGTGNIYIDDGSVVKCTLRSGNDMEMCACDDWLSGQVVKLRVCPGMLEVQTICPTSGRYLARGTYCITDE